MTSNDRITSDFIHDILDALERHGYVRGDDLHAGRAIGLIGDLARIYEGTQDHPADAHLITVPSSLPAEAEDRGQDRRDTVVLTGPDISTVIAVLDIAADYKRNRAAACADCADQTCLNCQSRLQDAQAYGPNAAPVPPSPSSTTTGLRADPGTEPDARRVIRGNVPLSLASARRSACRARLPAPPGKRL